MNVSTSVSNGVHHTQIRRARIEDADESLGLIRRSFMQLCHADHHGDESTIALWLADKTPENMRRWINQYEVFVAVQGRTLLGVCAMKPEGEIILNYVSPDTRFRGISKALMAQLEERASQLRVRTITLHSSATALKFYISAGYRENGPKAKGFGVTFIHPMIKLIR